MAAPLITRTPIHDDDGTGTKGTILDNAWKQELYSQIDADVAAVVAIPGMTKLYGGSGTNTATGTVAFVTPLIPALGVNDTLKVYVSVQQTGAAGNGMYLAILGQVNFLDLAAIAGGSMANGAQGLWEVTIRALQSNDLYYEVTALGGTDASHTGVGAARVGALTAHWLQGNWNLAVTSVGQSAGGVQYWSVTVYQIAG